MIERLVELSVLMIWYKHVKFQIGLIIIMKPEVISESWQKRAHHNHCWNLPRVLLSILTAILPIQIHSSYIDLLWNPFDVKILSNHHSMFFELSKLVKQAKSYRRSKICKITLFLLQIAKITHIYEHWLYLLVFMVRMQCSIFRFFCVQFCITQ